MSDHTASEEALHKRLIESNNNFVRFDKRLKVFLSNEDIILDRGVTIKLYVFDGKHTLRKVVVW